MAPIPKLSTEVQKLCCNKILLQDKTMKVLKIPVLWDKLSYLKFVETILSGGHVSTGGGGGGGNFFKEKRFFFYLSHPVQQFFFCEFHFFFFLSFL